MLKRVLAISVAAIMCLSLFAISAFADETDVTVLSESTSDAQAPVDGEDVSLFAATDAPESEGNDLLVAPAPEDGETVPALGVPTVGEPTEVASDVDTLADTTAESTTAAAAEKSDDLTEDDKNILRLVVVVVLLVVAGVSITILSRKKKRKTK